MKSHLGICAFDARDDSGQAIILVGCGCTGKDSVWQQAFADEAELLVQMQRPGIARPRLQFDALLRHAGLTPQDVSGYETEAESQLAVAAAVLTGKADCGPGVAAAASAMGVTPLVWLPITICARPTSLVGSSVFNCSLSLGWF